MRRNKTLSRQTDGIFSVSFSDFLFTRVTFSVKIYRFGHRFGEFVFGYVFGNLVGFGQNGGVT